MVFLISRRFRHSFARQNPPYVLVPRSHYPCRLPPLLRADAHPLSLYRRRTVRSSDGAFLCVRYSQEKAQ